MTIKFKGQNAEILEIIILSRLHALSQDYWDANWLHTQITVSVVGFSALYQTNARVEDFCKLYENISKLSDSRFLEFKTLEEGLAFSLAIKTSGSIICSGKAGNEDGNRLIFSFLMDNSQLDSVKHQLGIFKENYPLIGNADL